MAISSPVNDARKALRKATSMSIKTPVCEFQFPSLGTPQKGGEFDGVYGKYKATLVLDPENKEHSDFIDKLRARYDLALAQHTGADSNVFPVVEQRTKAKYLPNYKLGPGEDEDTQVLTGKLALTLTQKGGYMDDNREDVLNEVVVFGPDNVKYTKEEKDGLWSGTTGEVMLNTYAYYEAKKAGLTIKITAVRIKDARTSGGDPDPDDMFGEAWSVVDEDGSF